VLQLRRHQFALLQLRFCTDTGLLRRTASVSESVAKSVGQLTRRVPPVKTTIDMTLRVTALVLLPVSIWAAEFHNGQAARLVIGQPSFSARGAGISASNLLISGGRLYATDAAHHVLIFDLAKIPGPHDNLPAVQAASCLACGFAPTAVSNQPLLQGSPAVSIHGTTVALADTQNHRVLIWRDTRLSAANQMPDIVLGQANSDLISVNGRTLIEPISVAFDGKRLFVGDAALGRVLIWNSLPAVNNQPADVVLGQQNFTSTETSEVPRADAIHRPTALLSDGANLFVADSVDHRILVFTAADTPLPKNAISNSASLIAGPLAPGTLITITADRLADDIASAPDDTTQPLPTKLGNVEVLFDGVPLPLLSVSPAQVRAQIPYALASVSSASIFVKTEHRDGRVTTTNATAARIVPGNPGLFAFGGTEPRDGLILHASTSSDGQSGTPVTSENPARPGETLIVWAAGLGAVKDTGAVTPPAVGVPYTGSNAPVITPVSAVVNGRSAQVVSAVLPQGSIGIYEVRVVLPPNLPDDPKTQLLVAQNGYVSNKITVPVQSSIE
jgi:uncharacterized protein (TIGR03437 family)